MEKVKIIDFCNISNGFAFKSDKYISENGARVIRITNVQKGKIVDNDPKLYPFSELDKLEAYKIFEGDILMSLTGNVGRVGRFPKELLPAYINQRVCRVMPKNEKLDTNFLFHFLNSDVFENEAIKNSAGAAQLNLSTKWLGDFEIPLPNLATQQRIAAILDQADAIIQNNRAIVQKYDALTQSLFLDMFGDPVKNEKGWEKVRFDELVSKDCPLTYGIVQPGEEFEDGIPCVRPVDLTSQYIYVDELKRIDPKISSKFSRTLLKGGELLLSVRGSVGVISIADSSLVGSNVTRGIVPIWFDSEISNKLFFYYLYCTKEIQREVKALAKGATLIQINLKDLRELKIIKPPITLQNQFAERVAVIEAQKKQAQLELAKSEELFQSLLQRAFNGELN